jgi:hypothetical protein
MLNLFKKFLFSTSVFMSAFASAQIPEQEHQASAKRQWFALKYNVGLLMLPVGMEAQIDIAVNKHLHVTASASYCMQTAGWFRYKPFNEYSHFTGELRYSIPKNYCYNGFFAGPFYAWRQGIYSFMENGTPKTNYQYKWNAHSVGIVAGWSFNSTRRPIFILEVYLGYGYSPEVSCSARSTWNPTPDPTPDDHIDFVKSEETHFIRGGICIGVVK